MLSVCWCFVVIVLIIYIYAIFILQGVTEHLGDTQDSLETESVMQLEKFYSSIPRAMTSLFMTISGGVDWYEPMDVLKSIGWRFEAFFILYIFFMTFGVLN